ncbi:hypothetical protein [Paraburkholderia bannensis]|uniref:hypothetical protein n=1 Tax=Paraburkholderia bannensis TaxID=765414 RepID=UPI002AB75F5C|nr:hypothetical protein [Paraburkholderia bannensis]
MLPIQTLRSVSHPESTTHDDNATATSSTTPALRERQVTPALTDLARAAPQRSVAASGSRPRAQLPSSEGQALARREKQDLTIRRAWKQGTPPGARLPAGSVDPRTPDYGPVPLVPQATLVPQTPVEPQAPVVPHAPPSRLIPVIKRAAVTFASALCRDGGITAASTLVRELVGQQAAKMLNEASVPVKASVSGVVIGSVVLLNALAAYRQNRSGQANGWTRNSQMANVGMLTGASAVALSTGSFGKAAPLLVKAGVYSLARDTLNLMVRLDDHRQAGDGPNRNAVAMNTVAYGLNQFFVNILQSLPFSHSGTSAAAQAKSAKEALGALGAFSAFNGVGETMDALFYPGLTAFFDEYDKTAGLLGGVCEGVQAALGLEITPALHAPFGRDTLNEALNTDKIAGVSRNDVWDKVTGPVVGRLSLFVTLFTLIDTINKAGPALKLSPKDAELMGNGLAALAIAFMFPAFVGSASASPRQQALQRDIETGATEAEVQEIEVEEIELQEVEPARRTDSQAPVAGSSTQR